MLSPTQVKSLRHKPGNKITKVSDGNNLYLIIDQNDNKKWWYRYKSNGKQQTISLGCYPGTGLKEARDKANEYNALRQKGVNLRNHIAAEKAILSSKSSNTFGIVCDEWLALRKETWCEAHYEKVKNSLKPIKQLLANKPIDEITANDLRQILLQIQNSGAVETAHRIKGRCSDIFCYAISTGRATNDPTIGLKGALKPIDRGHRAATLNQSELGTYLSMFNAYSGSPIVASALKLAPMLFVRPGELVTAKWKDINFEKREWSYTVSKTRKNGVAETIVPLSSEAIRILSELKPFCGDSEYVFPSLMSKSKHISTNAILFAIRSLGIDKDRLCVHGFRAIARTMLDEELHYPVDVIEQQLAHVVRDPLGRAYNRTTHLKERHKMMEDWSKYLNNLSVNK